MREEGSGRWHKQRSILRSQFQRKFDVHSEVQVATCEDQLSISTSEECFAYMSGE